ncbi:hypothetical protein ACFXKW_38480 [Streptomyces sp. NPDC059193]|uniref:hypothetical protein n=1 Tax=Streptomyces sp. NPDC059193 TaxID=3346763 RepID=UPI00368846A3
MEATEGHGAKTGPLADWEYHVTTVEGLVPLDVENMLAALQERIADLAQTQPVTALRAVARLQDAVPASAIDTVRGARAAMVSWEAIGRALGCTRQSAHERFAHRVTD